MKIEKYDEEKGEVNWEVIFYSENVSSRSVLDKEPNLEIIAKTCIEKGYSHFEIVKTTTDIMRYSIDGDIND